jgi:hypothetical protein
MLAPSSGDVIVTFTPVVWFAVWFAVWLVAFPSWATTPERSATHPIARVRIRSLSNLVIRGGEMEACMIYLSEGCTSRPGESLPAEILCCTGPVASVDRVK